MRRTCDPQFAVQAICIAACYAENWPLLIVCPKSVLRVWPVELARWLPKHIMPEAKHLININAGKARCSRSVGLGVHRVALTCAICEGVARCCAGGLSTKHRLWLLCGGVLPTCIGRVHTLLLMCGVCDTQDWDKKLTAEVEAVNKRIVVTTVDLVKVQPGCRLVGSLTCARQQCVT